MEAVVIGVVFMAGVDMADVAIGAASGREVTAEEETVCSGLGVLAETLEAVRPIEPVVVGSDVLDEELNGLPNGLAEPKRETSELQAPSAAPSMQMAETRPSSFT
ncbi:MAG: hypothetical protein ACRDBH_00500 [Bosea sp. (in: a-proteobacteria)]